jgi:zinc transport system ATP-binding protein
MTPTAVFRLVEGSVLLDGRRLLDSVTVRIDPGEFVAVLGANGSGKTTLIRTLLGLLPLTSGRLELFGSPLPEFRAWTRLGYVPQRLSAGGGVPATVREVVAAGRVGRLRRLRPASAADRAAVAAALDTVGLTARAGDRVGTLSGGQQQRVLIARALAGEPDVLVLDEPMAGVDSERQDALADTLASLAGHGRTVLLVAHELGPLEPLVTRSLVLVGGRVVHDGVPPPVTGYHAVPGHEHVHPHPASTAARPTWHLP